MRKIKDVARSVKPHYHISPSGLLIRCYHQSRTAIFSVGFWLGVTLSFPIEHYLWEKVWPFYAISKWLGL